MPTPDAIYRLMMLAGSEVPVPWNVGHTFSMLCEAPFFFSMEDDNPQPAVVPDPMRASVTIALPEDSSSKSLRREDSETEMKMKPSHLRGTVLLCTILLLYQFSIDFRESAKLDLREVCLTGTLIIAQSRAEARVNAGSRTVPVLVSMT